MQRRDTGPLNVSGSSIQGRVAREMTEFRTVCVGSAIQGVRRIDMDQAKLAQLLRESSANTTPRYGNVASHIK